MSKNRELAELGDKVTVDSGNVGIGTDSPTSALDVRETATSTVPLRLETAGGAANAVRPQISMYSGGSNGYHISTIRSNLSNDPYGLAFVENTTERMRILSSGGITFNGDTSSANALDDYEEGTWTPVLQNATTTTYTQQYGTYTKVGNLVYANCRLQINARGDGDSNGIDGFPFTSSSPNGNGHHASFGYWTGSTTSTIAVYSNMVGTVLEVMHRDSSGTTVTNPLNFFKDGARIDFSIVYRT